jgi:hypothetical protein
MNCPPQIWTSSAFHPAFRCGGWASVRGGGGQVAGAAGGERHTTARRMALASLAAGLGDLPPSREIDIRTSDPELAHFANVLERLGRKVQTAPPEDDLDLWARIIAASAGRRLNLVFTPHEPGGPNEFTNAWAELARDKAKASGAFTAAIPRVNLVKVVGLASQ